MSSQRLITWHESPIQKSDRRQQNGHHSFVLWLTGYSGAGKSTLANAVQAALYAQGVRVYLLDGDNLRMGLNADLGFSAEDRKENVRRVAEVAKLFVDAGTVVITALISPYQRDRDEARARYQADEFVEVFVDCHLDVCQQRDPKGLYAKARRGEISDFTGVQAPYEAPEHAEIVVHTDKQSIEASASQVMSWLKEQGYIGRA